MRASRVLRPLVLLGLAAGAAAITSASLGYFNDDELPAFVIEKLPLPYEDLWLWALRAHVVAALWSLPACLFLSLDVVMKRLPRVHRWVGRVTGVGILFALVPSGFYLSLFAKGGLPATVGFMLSGVVTLVAMARAVLTARARRFVEHRRWTMHVLAQLSVAVTSRVMMLGFDALDVEPLTAYLISLWVPVVGSAGLVEVLFHPRAAPRRSHGPLRIAHDPHPVHAGAR
ncbi:MAG: DUF2306 domain-containing protein [Archangium sp.]|nr:DUF2306 domain-containing protein [Archangium sp.]